MEELIGTKFSFRLVSDDGNDSLNFGTPCFSRTRRHSDMSLLMCFSKYGEDREHKAGIYLDYSARRQLAAALLNGLPPEGDK